MRASHNKEPDDDEVTGGAEVPRDDYRGSVSGSSNIIKALATIGALLVTAAISFAYGRIFDHEARISGIEAVERYKEQQQRTGAQNGRP